MSGQLDYDESQTERKHKSEENCTTLQSKKEFTDFSDDEQDDIFVDNVILNFDKMKQNDDQNEDEN